MTHKHRLAARQKLNNQIASCWLFHASAVLRREFTKKTVDFPVFELPVAEASMTGSGADFCAHAGGYMSASHRQQTPMDSEQSWLVISFDLKPLTS